MTIVEEDVNDNDIDDSKEDDNMMTAVTRRRMCKRRRVGAEKRRTTILEDVGKKRCRGGRGQWFIDWTEIVVVVVVVLLTILLIAVISKITIPRLHCCRRSFVRVLKNRTGSRKINRFRCTGKRVNIQAMLHIGIPPPSDWYWTMMCWWCCWI